MLCIFLIIVEIVTIFIAVILKHLGTTTSESELLDFQDDLGFFLIGKILVGIVVTFILSLIAIAIYLVVLRLVKQVLNYSVLRVFFFQGLGCL
ncbi:hypothetical protein SAMN05660236_0424 [Ohtaekwangia koreensis]|uniref:Uncharacterized protein n=1 Tax=Ohtaekwangia koreensis TaxID=688867 RepID=A0A1T5IUI4_9BACT|nr:hypothetical protein SAMN05660236_0424 [Ohtaekwangia koreensis]